MKHVIIWQKQLNHSQWDNVLSSTRWQCCLIFILIFKPRKNVFFIIIQNIYDALAKLCGLCLTRLLKKPTNRRLNTYIKQFKVANSWALMRTTSRWSLMWPFRDSCFRSLTVFLTYFRRELHFSPQSTPVRLHGNTFECPETASLYVERLRHALWPSCPWKRARPSRSRPFIARKHLWEECHPVILLQMDLSACASDLHFGGFAVSAGDFARLRWSVAKHLARALAAGIHRCFYL